MSKYVLAQEQTFDALLKQIESTRDPLHQAMLRNYMRHMSMEISGRWSEFVDDHDRMMAEHPLYHVRLGTPDTVEFKGIAGVKEFYSTIDGAVWMLQKQQTAVADWGLAAEIFNTQLLNGSDILAAGMDIGIEIDDPDAVYVLEDIKIAMFWPYDDKARLMGEDVYQLEPPRRVAKCAPEDVATKQDIERSLQRFFTAY